MSDFAKEFEAAVKHIASGIKNATYDALADALVMDVDAALTEKFPSVETRLERTGADGRDLHLLADQDAFIAEGDGYVAYLRLEGEEGAHSVTFSKVAKAGDPL